jgi:hypothetical protein
VTGLDSRDQKGFPIQQMSQNKEFEM